jgi:hypothetical protein
VCCGVWYTCRTNGHERTRKRSLDVGLLHGAERFTELEDAGADRVLVKGSGTLGDSGRGGGSDRWLWSRSIQLGVFVLSRGSQLELQLCLGSTDESLEDSRVGVVEDDIAAGRVGIALEDDGLVGRDAEKMAELWESQPGCTITCHDKAIVPW